MSDDDIDAEGESDPEPDTRAPKDHQHAQANRRSSADQETLPPNFTRHHERRNRHRNRRTQPSSSALGRPLVAVRDFAFETPDTLKGLRAWREHHPPSSTSLAPSVFTTHAPMNPPTATTLSAPAQRHVGQVPERSAGHQRGRSASTRRRDNLNPPLPPAEIITHLSAEKQTAARQDRIAKRARLKEMHERRHDQLEMGHHAATSSSAPELSLRQRRFYPDVAQRMQDD